MRGTPMTMTETLAAPPVPDLARVSLFVDLDGTIAPLEATPQAVGPDRDRRRLLDALANALGGRLAVVSGRSLADLDRVLEGRVTALGAVHGLVRRKATGEVVQVPVARRIEDAVAGMRDFARKERSLLVENKGPAVALHYRGNPGAGPASRKLARRLAGELGLSAIDGDMVTELRGPGPDKGEAIAAFMAEAPFAGHPPIFIGDDLTDEDGFRAARELGGFGVVVGPRRPTQAAFTLAGVDAVRRWLALALASAA